MKVATGLAIGDSAKPELAAQAVESAMQKANIHAPSSVLLFLTSEFAADPQSAIKAAARAASCTQVIGCSATGIFTEEDWVLDSPAAAVMVFSDNVVLKTTDTALDHILLTLAAPNAINSTWLNTSGARFGGISGDATGHGPFSVWQNGKGSTQGYCNLVVDQTRCAVAASHGLQLISSPRRITGTAGNDILSVANIPAYESLQLAWQKHSDGNDNLPYHQLMLAHADKASLLERGDYNVASFITGNEEDKSLTMTKALPEGEWVCWAMRDVDAAQIDMVRTASSVKQQLATEPEFALLFSCLGRGPYFYNGTDQDLALVKAFYPNLPIIGFYGNGEIAPIHGRNELLQYSAVLALFASASVSSL